MNRILAGIVFLITFFVYFDTMAPTVSYWDCGEFIATSYIVGVPHPPGSPFYLIIGRLFSILPFSDDIGFRVNLISPLSSALAVMVLYLVIVQFVTHWRGPVKTLEDRFVAFGSALIGALAFAFTDSHWFNAVEAEVYGMSTLFTALVVWLILRWAEKSDEVGNERYLLIIGYVLGLASGVHLLNLLALPFMGLIIYFKQRQFSWLSFLGMAGIVAGAFLVIYLGIIKGFPRLASFMGVTGVVVLVLAVFGGTIFVIRRGHRLWSLVLSSLLLVMIGYSTYAILFIRSNQNPAIDENDPETVGRAVKYLEREQYGSITFLPRRYIKDRVGSFSHKAGIVGRPRGGRDFSTSQDLKYMFHNFGRQVEFLWDYQIVRMYIRYFFWQFAGRGPAGSPGVTNFGAIPSRLEDGVNWFQFVLPLPFFLGMVGMFYHFKKDTGQGLSVLTLFFMTGLAIIFYLNQDKFQPRERDYSYVGSFLAFSVWVGIGTAALLEKVSGFLKGKPWRVPAAYGMIGVLMLIVPGIMASSNYRSHDRSGNFVAWDYSYNILQTSEPNGIIFTNGDNDTFPLWYLQEVEGIRKDVSVVNLSLLNTEWYIRQLKRSRPPGERFVNFTDEQIMGIKSIGINPATGQSLHLQVSIWKKTPVSVPVENDSENSDGEISWELKPTMGQGIRVQDLMIVHILKESRWRYPIYFAVTVSPKNRIGLEKYLQMEGLAFRVKSHEVSSMVNYEKLASNMSPVDSTGGWSKDYKPGYKYRNLNNPDVYYNPNIVKLLQNYRSAFLELAARKYRSFQKKQKDPQATEDDIEQERQAALGFLDQLMELMPPEVIPITSEEHYFRLGQLYYHLDQSEKAKKIFENIHDSARADVVGYLLKIYDDAGYWDEAIDLLESWLRKFPEDSVAIRLLEDYREKGSQETES